MNHYLLYLTTQTQPVIILNPFFNWHQLLIFCTHHGPGLLPAQLLWHFLPPPSPLPLAVIYHRGDSCLWNTGALSALTSRYRVIHKLCWVCASGTDVDIFQAEVLAAAALTARPSWRCCGDDVAELVFLIRRREPRDLQGGKELQPGRVCVCVCVSHVSPLQPEQQQEQQSQHLSINSAQTHTFSVLRAFIDCIWVLSVFLRLSAELHLLCFVLKQLVGGGMGQGDERRCERCLGSLEVLSLHRSHHAARRFIWRFKINYVTLQDLDISYMVSVFYSSEQTIVTIVFFQFVCFFVSPKDFKSALN